MSVDYGLYYSAEITVIWSHNKVDDQHVNIFSVVELIPAEQELSSKIEDVGRDGNKLPMRRIQVNSVFSIYAARFVVNIEDAIAFFGKESISGRNIKINNKTIALQSVNSMTVEPSENHFILVPPNLCPETPFGHVLPRRSVSSRVRARIDANAETLKMFSENDQIKISEFIKETLGIDLLNFSEFFGAVILSCPNPYIRKFEERLSRDRQKIVYEIYERQGQSLIDGEIEISEERPSGKGFVIRELIKKNKGIINIPYEPCEFRTRMFSKQKELIEDMSGHFIKSINLSMGIIGGKREIHEINQKDGMEMIHKVDVITDEVHSIVGDSLDIKTPTILLTEKEKHRVMDALKMQREFIYFPGKTNDSVENARQILREIISKASERCMIVDPYLSGPDVIKFSLFVSNSKFEIRLISSAAFLSKKYNEDGDEEIDNDPSNEQLEVQVEPVTYGGMLNSTIEQLMKQDKTLRLKCRVLKGRKKSPVHDRFLIVDNEVYILGSSLNEFGSRATTLFRVPDPRVIIGEAEKWWQDDEISIDLGQWLSRR
ncbi:VPA1262 family N-terminal domain-containing protein [Pelosinus sp. sgz500959]|uniref:VPA1262 family N-terminal domain-containing protein n=1 Tax=Pelosinus sp. sgz500959 TaxID=3242472 RepID=UPI00366E6091